MNRAGRAPGFSWFCAALLAHQFAFPALHPLLHRHSPGGIGSAGAPAGCAIAAAADCDEEDCVFCKAGLSYARTLPSEGQAWGVSAIACAPRGNVATASDRAAPVGAAFPRGPPARRLVNGVRFEG